MYEMEYYAKSLQSCLTLCDLIDGSLPGSPIPGILQARTLEWVAISFSNVWKWKVKGKSLSRVRLSATPWTAAHQAPPSMEFSRQEYWSGVPLSSPNGILLRHKKGWNFAICNNMDGHGGYFAQWKSQRETNNVCYHLYVESKNWNKLVNITNKEQAHRYRKQTSGY